MYEARKVAALFPLLFSMGKKEWRFFRFSVDHADLAHPLTCERSSPRYIFWDEPLVSGVARVAIIPDFPKEDP